MIDLQAKHLAQIAQELQISLEQVSATALLLDNDATIPFIARYRKEATGSLDEVKIALIRDRLEQLRELDKRRDTILKTIQEQGKLTPELELQIKEATTMSVLEDLYLPYKPKRRTRATIAREKGLEPLSEKIFTQEDFDLENEAKQYINTEKGVNTIEEALSGARDIIAEKINEDAEARAKMRVYFQENAIYYAKVIEGKEEEGAKYKDYFEWQESLQNAPSHRILAMRRAEKEEIISLDINPDEENAIQLLEDNFVNSKNPAGEQVKLAIKDCYKRLLKSSIETEMRLLSKRKADEEAIKVFAENLRQLLLASPLGEKRILAIDPGIRTGCKTVCLDAQGNLLEYTVIFPDRRKTEATEIITSLCEKYQIQAIAIGNGTASRETETFVRTIGLDKSIIIVMVNESGASIYSASDVAREEFPDHDITVRGAVSIGRRLLDPLAELVKIDPKSIGVGQYQHDVDQNQLKTSLDDTVISCVNAVGVDVNTASKQLLMYVSGLGQSLAQNIIDYRQKNGAFKTRQQLKKVPRLGEKAFEQSAGFLRIRGAENPLDYSAVHPESYTIVEKMAKDQQCTVSDLMTKADIRQKIDIKSYVTEKIGLPTLHDIVSELAKPARDPREAFEVVQFADDVHTMDDLKIGMSLTGIVTNITNFGAFVDIGVHQDGLVHISQMSTKRIASPNEVVKVQQKVQVTVTDIDIPRKRIALSMIGGLQKERPNFQREKQDFSKENKSFNGNNNQNQNFQKNQNFNNNNNKNQNSNQNQKNTQSQKQDNNNPEDFMKKLEELKKKFGQ